jgi:5-methylcytosine-specific restriction endonuclease McrA
MLKLADLVRRHGPAYVRRFRAGILPSHVRALDRIALCRTPALGGHLAVCTRCSEEHILFHSCRHRACPQCGHDATSRWLARQRELLLPVPYFHVVFTLPEELRDLVRSHQRALVAALFRAAFDSLAALGRDEHFLGAHIGALAVLHTWTRTLEWHPHVHILVPAGGLAPDGRTWRPLPRRKRRFLLPVKALATRFRGQFLHLARRALPGVPFPHIPWDKPWIVFAKPVAHGADKILEYLGRYVHRTAMSDRALIAMDDTTVTFRYRDSRDHRHKVLTLAAHEMLRRFLQHVPPKGMHRVRAFGVLHPAERDTLRRLQLLLAPRSKKSEHQVEPEPTPRRARTQCAHCGEPGLALVRRFEPNLTQGPPFGSFFELRRARAPPDATAQRADGAR